MFKSRFLRNAAAMGFLVLFILLTGIRAESSTMPTDDQLLKIIPAESLFCIRVNHFEYTLSQIDQFLADVSPTPMGISILARTQFAKVLGSPQLNGVNMNGSFAVFGAIPPGEPTQTNPISKVFIGGLVPVTDYRQLISGNPNCSQADEKGISKITSNGTPIMLVTQAGNYALISWANDYDKLVVMAKSISASKAAGLASALDAAEAKLAMTEPIWVYGNVQQASRTFGPLVLDKIGEVKTQMRSIEPNRPGAPPRNIQTLAENMINMYVSIFETLMKETSSVSLTLRPKPTALNLKVGVSAVSGTDMANMFVADASAAQENKLLGYLEDGAIVNVGFKANTPFLKKLNDKRFDLLAVIAGEGITAEDTAKLKILATDMVDSLGGLAAFSFSIDAKNKPPFAIKYVIEVKDADKFDKVIKESIEMMNTSGIMDFYKSFGLEMSFAIKQDIERYKGVSIDSAKLVMKSTDPNSPQGQMMNAMFVDGFDYRWGIVNGLWVCTVSSDPDSAIRELIDQVKANGPMQMGDEMRKALTLLPEANQADFVATYNFLRWFKMVGAIMPMPMPMLQMDIPTRSNIVFAGKAGNGKMVVDIVLPKEHLTEIVAAFQMMQQQQKKIMQQKQPGSPRSRGIDSISPEETIWVKCQNPDCKSAYRMGKKAYYKYIEKHADPMSKSAPALVCKKCGNESIYRAEKCQKCGLIFLSGAVPNDFADRCPKCKYSKTEDARKRRLKATTAKPRATIPRKFVIPKKNLQIPEDMQACSANLQKILAAIRKYEKDKGELPNWLSDLVPDYVTNDALLCANDPIHKSRYSPDPKLPCSYAWEFSSDLIPTGRDPTRRTRYRDWKTQQLKLFGDILPMVRCMHHGYNNRVLSLSTGGQIYWGDLNWEETFISDYRFGDESRSQPSQPLRPPEPRTTIAPDQPTDKLDLSGSQTTDADLAERLEGLRSLRELNLSRTQITNNGLAHLRGLSSLRRLFLGNTQITDSGLTYLRNLTSLQYLCFHGTQVGDTGLAHLKDLASLQSLCLHDTQVSDDGLAHLKGLTSLRILHLRNTKISDAGLAHIKNLTELQDLCVHNTQISDAGLEYLKDLASLQSLCLHDTQVGDDGLAHLRGLTSLKRLYLQNTQVSDVGLVHLKDLTSLKQLNLNGTKVSSTGLAELEQTLPNCRISGPDAPVTRRAESPLIDKPAPSFTLQDLNGKQVSLSDFKGKVVLLDFWATWCGPCRKAIPHLEVLHKKYKDQGLVLIGINHERDHDKVKEFAKEQISYVVLLDADEQFTEYGISGIPTAFYIDREGKIRYRDVGFGSGKEKEIEQKVKELLFGKEEIKLVTARERQESSVPKKEEVPVLRKQKPPPSQRLDGNMLAFDSFDGRLNLKWDILHTDLSHISLTKNPGTLTITTQKGSLRGSNKNYKNLFLIDCPSRADGDFQITTCLSSFKPVARYQQAGLICYNDEDNFLRFVYQWRPGQCEFNSKSEIEGGKASTAMFPMDEQFERVWLRVTKSGSWYTFSTSLDGKSFRDRGAFAWGDGLVKGVGIFATNGLPSKAPEIDASFDFFEVKAAPAKPRETVGVAAKFIVPSKNLRIPKELRACAANLKTIQAAIKKYEKDKSKLPDWLSDLVPDYLSKETLLCPIYPRPRAQYYPDPKLPCSYSWEFSRTPTLWDPKGKTLSRDWKTQQGKFFGNVVPMVRCLNHMPKRLNLSVGGQIYLSPLDWEKIFKPDYRFGDESPGRQQRVIQPAGRLKITGMVRDEGGIPVDGVEISILPSGGRDFRSGTEGKFEVNWQPRSLGGRQREYYLVAQHRQRNLAAAVEIDEDTNTLDIKLKLGVIFAGKVVGTNGEGINGARIMTMLWGSNWGSSLGPGQVADVKGKFEVRALPLGHKYSLTARAEGYGEKRIEVHTNDAVDNRVNVGRLVLAVADLSVSGLVVDENDKPVAGARVYCFGEGQQSRNAQTDTNGKFTLENICEGQIRITASVSGKTRLYGYTQTEGGATDVKIVISERPSATRYIPKQPPSLRGKLVPNMKDLKIEPSPADVDTKDEEGLTALHLAARQGRKDAVELLLANGANINTRLTGWPGWMPLHEAAAANHKEVAELLIAKGADANADCARAGGGRFGGTPLHEAVFEGHRDMAELLISKGANINAKQSGGLTPLDVAAFVGHKDVVELLIARGANVNIRDRGGRTALRWAKHGRHKEIVELLQKHGAVE